MALVYIGLGSNLNTPILQIKTALIALNNMAEIKITAISSLYGSRPMGPQDQPDYINAVLALETTLSPIALLDVLQQIELDSGRIRKDERWGARTLDLDILLFDQQIIDSERLTVPHYGIKEREFVLIPLAEIAPELHLPSGENIATLANNIAQNDLAVIETINVSDYLG